MLNYGELNSEIKNHKGVSYCNEDNMRDVERLKRNLQIMHRYKVKSYVTNDKCIQSLTGRYTSHAIHSLRVSVRRWALCQSYTATVIDNGDSDTEIYSLSS